jgi:hypothetical protein
VATPIKKKGPKAPLIGVDGVVLSKHPLIVSSPPWVSLDQHHPVRSIKGGFASFCLMSRPPLLG